MTGEAAATRLEGCEFRGRFGVARAEITPPAGIPARNWGSSTHEFAEGVHKPLYATCLAIAPADGGSQQGRAEGIRQGGNERLEQGSELFLLTADLSWWRSRADEAGLREAILQQAGLAPHQLILHPSHTHAAPPTAPELAHQPGGHLIPEYRAALVRSFVELVQRARAKQREGTLTWARGSCGLAFNRNYPAAETGAVLCGLNPAAAADDTLLVGRIVDDASGKPVAAIVNYACHPTSLGGANRLISPDYVGRMREVIETHWGGTCLFLHGASADMTPRRSFESDPSVADRNGEEVAYAALSALSSMLPPRTALKFSGVEQSGTALAVWSPQPVEPSAILRSRQVSLQLPLLPMPSRGELEQQLAECKDGYMRERLRRKLMLRQTVGDGPECEFTFTVWQLGSGFLVGTPAEAYTSFQASLRDLFPSNSIAVLNIVNGYLSYLPPQSEYALQTYQAKVALFEAGSTERVLEAVSQTIRELLEAA